MSCAHTLTPLGSSVLVLNRFYMAVHIVNVRRAFALLFRDLAEVIHCEEGQYANYNFNSWREIGELKSEFKEPMKSEKVGDKYKVYRRIREEFIGPWTPPTVQGGTSSRRRRKYSMILYGPPGTAKSSMAREVANALGWPMISITPSEFVAEGPGAVEARAKAIFDALQTRR